MSKMAKNYAHHNLSTQVNSSHSRTNAFRQTGGPTRRVWVKRAEGNPTTIMTGPDDLVDDLKLAITNKFPNSLARSCDPADIQLLLKTTQERVQQLNRQRFGKTSYGRIKEEQIDESYVKLPTTLHLTQLQASYIHLEPDQNVWDVIDENFSQPMTISDAFLIEVPAESQALPQESRSHQLESQNLLLGERARSPLQQWISQRSSPLNSNPVSYHHPKPQYPIQMQGLKQVNPGKNRSVSPNLMNGNSPVQTFPGHKRSVSTPPQSPVSFNQTAKSNNNQAILLLPKNFSLGDQHSGKRYSVDDSSSRRHSTRGDFSKPNNNNLSNVGVQNLPFRPSSDDAGPIDHQDQSKQSSKLRDPNSFEKSDTEENQSSKQTPERKENTPIPGQLKSSEVSSKNSLEKTINTSTFEKVLPSISVLVVEDNSINQAILGAFLRKHKIHYQMAKNGQEAVDKWRKGGFHLVLMDIQLPVKSGIEATKEIRHLEKINRIGVFAQHELTNTNYNSTNFEITDEEKLDLNVFRSPVIIVALTASSNSSVDKKTALTAGCNDFLTKPVNLVWLQNKITEWGCMQALIDFEGWKFKRKPQGPSTVKGGSAMNRDQSLRPDKLDKRVLKAS